MGALGAIWANVLATAQAAGQNVVTAAEQSAAAGVNSVRASAGGAIQATGIGLGGAIAPSGTTPSNVAWLSANPAVPLVGAFVLILLLRGRE